MGYAVKLARTSKQIYNGDKVDVALTGSNTGTYTFSVCYVGKTEICLLSDDNMGNANWSTACAKSWGWSLTLPNGKSYASTDAGQSAAKIPTLEEISQKCAGYSRNFIGHTSSGWSGANTFIINGYGPNLAPGAVTAYAGNMGSVPYIHVYL